MTDRALVFAKASRVRGRLARIRDGLSRAPRYFDLTLPIGWPSSRARLSTSEKAATPALSASAPSIVVFGQVDQIFTDGRTLGRHRQDQGEKR